MKKFVIRMVLGALGGILIFHGVHRWNSRGDGFCLYKIQSRPPYEERWNISYSPEEMSVAIIALQQPFRYLGHGFQCYAFVSRDDQYVLKFFRHQRLRLPECIASLPSIPLFDQWRKNRILFLSRRKDYLMRSCVASWTLAKEETELLMVHLNTTRGLFPTVAIIDPFGTTHRLPLDEYQFLLQRKAVHIKPTIANCMKTGDLEGAQNRISQIFALFVRCARKGIEDTDGALIRKNNLGFFQDRAIYIDGGKLQQRTGKITKKAFKRDLRRLRPLRRWLETEYPQLLPHFKEEQKKAVHCIEIIEEGIAVCSN